MSVERQPQCFMITAQIVRIPYHYNRVVNNPCVLFMNLLELRYDIKWGSRRWSSTPATLTGENTLVISITRKQITRKQRHRGVKTDGNVRIP